MHQFANKIYIKTIYHSMRHVATDSHIRIVIIIHVLISWYRPSERFQVDWDDIICEAELNSKTSTKESADMDATIKTLLFANSTKWFKTN